MKSKKLVFVICGFLFLSALCSIPIKNALALMVDTNYVFWIGRATPLMLIFVLAFIIGVYIFTTLAFFGSQRPVAQTEQIVMMFATIFTSFVGVTLMVFSLPLSRQATETYNDLMHRCDTSELTFRTYEYSQVLQKIRHTPECKLKRSVEECYGYEDAPPFTAFLKDMEENFRCSGFCYRPVTEVAASQFEGAQLRHRRVKQASMTFLGTDSAEELAREYPLALFSQHEFKSSCEGMAARDMRNFVGDIGFQSFEHGIYLIGVGVVAGFLKLAGFCLTGDARINAVLS